MFYPALLREADPDGEETEDAIGDHNDIRDADRRARTRSRSAATTGGRRWTPARESNSEHMAEEEREGLADFRRNAAQELRDRLGDEFARYKAEHPGGARRRHRRQGPGGLRRGALLSGRAGLSAWGCRRCGRRAAGRCSAAGR